MPGPSEQDYVVHLSNMSSADYSKGFNSSDFMMKLSQLNRSLDAKNMKQNYNFSPANKGGRNLNDLKQTLQNFTSTVTSNQNNRIRVKSKFKISGVTNPGNISRSKKSTVSTKMGEYNILQPDYNSHQIKTIEDNIQRVRQQTPGYLAQTINNLSPNLFASKRDRTKVLQESPSHLNMTTNQLSSLRNQL